MGRFVVAAIGSGMAYSFDSENSACRRKELHRTVHRVTRNGNAGMGPDAVDPPTVFRPVPEAQSGQNRSGRPAGQLRAAR